MLNKLLIKNFDYQKSIETLLDIVNEKMDQKKKQVKTLNDILKTIPQDLKEINQKEKCSAYLALEVLHVSKQRKVYSNNIIRFDNIQLVPENLKFIDVENKPRFRQQCKKLTKTKNKTPTKRKDIRDLIINEIVDILPKQQLIQWDLIQEPANRILNYYTSDQEIIQVLEIYKAWLKQQSQIDKTFTQSEDEELIKLVSQCGNNQWAYIAKLIPTKTSTQLRERWFKNLDQSIKRKRWTLKEDLKLVILVDYFGVGQWNNLQKYFENRTEIQIRERWCNVLDPDLEIKDWSKEDDQKLLELQLIHGNAWSIISLELQRTDNECRRRFQQFQKQ
ncbi:hypothetical protein pb186bvf_010527 [Paramecium bursaria]